LGTLQNEFVQFHLAVVGAGATVEFRGGYPPEQIAEGEAWIQELEFGRLEAASRPAMRIATSARDIAKTSMIIAVVAATITIIATIIAFLAWWFPRQG